MIKAITAPTLSSALAELKKLTAENESKGKQTIVFCEDRLTLAAERTVCAAVEGTFTVSVFTFARFLTAERGACPDILTSQGSAMAIRKLIDENREKLHLFKRLSTAAAAQEVYDTIALLYSSRITAEDVRDAATDNKLLRRKLDDLALLYELYTRYLSDNGVTDRNGYLRQLPEVITRSQRVRGADVVFLGFQSFTCSVSECAAACMDAAKNVYGIFIGGEEDIYTNESYLSFAACARQFGGCLRTVVPTDLCEEAETLRKNLFHPESYHDHRTVRTDKVTLFEGSDRDDEMTFIAASIKKHVLDEGVRFRSISVMLPDVKGYQGVLERVFSEYAIPFYVDRSYCLAEHPLCDFLLGYLACVQDGCTAASVNAVVASSVFHANRKDKDIFVNYMLRLASFRGGVKRQPKTEILEKLKFDPSAVERVRTVFLNGLELLPRQADGETFCAALRRLSEKFGVRETLEQAAENFKDEYPTRAELSARAYDEAISVIDEAEKLTRGLRLTAREFAKILKSGFTAAEISLIPPKQDAVFVGDLAATANTGSEVVFAAGLTDAVPCSSQDTAILTDRELGSLEQINLIVSPKIAQVNLRAREMTALNLCAFKKRLYLSYPTAQSGEERIPSEVIAYAKRLFATPAGAPLSAINTRRILRSERAVAYYCSQPVPALRQAVNAVYRPEVVAAIYAVLCENGYREQADNLLAQGTRDDALTCGRQLYGGGISPTALENYFACPYKSFMRTGLRVAEREEGAIRPLDSGNFIHAVLQKLAYTVNAVSSEEELCAAARETAEKLLLTPEYAALSATKRGKYTADALVGEAVEVSAGMYEQLKNSRFSVSGAEQPCEVVLDEGIRLFGYIDRVDTCGDMVRIIDYKTGSVDSTSVSYYMGRKLQLPLYLQAAAKGKRAVGAYYFPAAVEYKEKADGVFRLKGFMDGSEDVVRTSDVTLEEKKKSNYFDAYLNGRKVEYAMSRDDFADFLLYSNLVARKGAAELMGGNVRPSPAEGACNSCAYAGSCGFAVGTDGEERKPVKVTCAKIAQIVREERGG